MKIETLVFTALLFVIAIGGWYLYREHFIFRGQDEEIVRKMLADKANFINDAAKKLDIDQRLLASVIYTELRVNVNLLDSFERVFASLGNNTSIGLAQIRINTAKWIIDTVKDSNSYYFLESQYHKWLPKYERREDIVKLLENDSTNCLLAAFHLRQIITRWEHAGFDLWDRPDIVATLYSYGLFRRDDNSEIVPHAKPRSNFFGKVAADFFYSGKMRSNFP
jgi:hypothetical protein